MIPRERTDRPTKRIAIVGAGATGMVQLKNLLDVFGRPEVEYDLEVVVFESKSEVGGVWYVLSLERPCLFFSILKEGRV